MAVSAAGDEVLPRKRTMPVLDGGDSQPCTTSRTSAPDSSSSRTAASVAPRTVSVVSATVLIRRRLNSSCNRSIAFVVRALFHGPALHGAAPLCAFGPNKKEKVWRGFLRPARSFPAPSL